MGQNMVGWLRIRVKGNAGDSVRLRFAETLQPDGELYTANLRSAKVTDLYILKGEGIEEWAPRFVYHGFRYVEVSEFPGTPTLANFTGEVVNDNMPLTGTFECDNPILNQLVKNAFWGIRAGVLALIVKAMVSMYRQAPKGLLSYLMMGGALAAVAFCEVNVILVIAVCVLVGILAGEIAAGRSRKE